MSCFNLFFILKGVMSLILVIDLKVVFCALKVNIYFQNMSIKRRLARFDKKDVYIPCVCVCAACLPASLIRHVPISELHA